MDKEQEFSSIEIGVFNQSRFWVNSSGKDIEIIEMETRYIEKVIKFLEINANDFYLLYLKSINKRLEARDESLLMQEKINHSFTGKQSWEYTPREWLSSTSLFRALLTELRLREK